MTCVRVLAAAALVVALAGCTPAAQAPDTAPATSVAVIPEWWGEDLADWTWDLTGWTVAEVRHEAGGHYILCVPPGAGPIPDREVEHLVDAALAAHTRVGDPCPWRQSDPLGLDRG